MTTQSANEKEVQGQASLKQQKVDNGPKQIEFPGIAQAGQAELQHRVGAGSGELDLAGLAESYKMSLESLLREFLDMFPKIIQDFGFDSNNPPATVHVQLYEAHRKAEELMFRAMSVVTNCHVLRTLGNAAVQKLSDQLSEADTTAPKS